MHPRSQPTLYQLNTRVRLSELSLALARPATLDDITDVELDELASLGFDWLWLLGVWQTGPASRQVSLTQPDWQPEFRDTLPDLREEDVCGSCFAITAYQVHRDFGGNPALGRLRRRLRQRGIRLMLDFVPNHGGLDHPWLRRNPDFFVHGSESQLRTQPMNFRRLQAGGTSHIVAHGRDPYFPGWPDTLQFNYGNAELQAAMHSELAGVAELCDGVRCDMAMLLLPEVFERTWGIRIQPFWPTAIDAVAQGHPDFVFMAEVYWGLEWELQQQGFHYTYDKTLYDRLLARDAVGVRQHLLADDGFQARLVRFLENHDEARAATALSEQAHGSAAVIGLLTPGMRLLHHGQLEGRRKRIPPHLARAPVEARDPWAHDFYRRLLGCMRHPAARHGRWRLLECLPVSKQDPSHEQLVAFAWHRPGHGLLLVVSNHGPLDSRCHLPLPFGDMEDGPHRLHDRMSDLLLLHQGAELRNRGLYLQLPGWDYRVFDIAPANARD